MATRLPKFFVTLAVGPTSALRSRPAILTRQAANTISKRTEGALNDNQHQAYIPPPAHPKRFLRHNPSPRSIATQGEFEQVELNASERMSDFQGIRGSRGIACEMIKTGVQTFEFA